MKQRIVFVNLHADWMLLRVAMVYIFKYSAAIKHGYLLKYLLDRPEEYEVCNYINDNGFSLYTKAKGNLKKFLNLFSGPENWLTLKKNGIPSRKIKVIRNPKDIRKDDIVIAYNICNQGLEGLEKVDALKVLSMLHFHGRKGEDERIKKAGIDVLFNETDLSKTSGIYQKFYNLELPFIVHPFIPADRFKRVKPFKDRQNKCFSTGTITLKTHPEFIEVYGDPCDQPARKFVKDNPEFFKDTVDCYSEYYMEDTTLKKVNPTDNSIVKLYKKLYNRFHSGTQKKYFSFDMVEKFNDYKMHLLGEEILGVPGIGYVEGMACGSAYIGLDSPMYRDLGLIPGVHYISYDGTKEGLKKTIEYWQRSENQEKLEEIANNGYNFVREHLNSEKVAKKLIDSLVKLKQEDKNVEI